MLFSFLWNSCSYCRDVPEKPEDSFLILRGPAAVTHRTSTNTRPINSIPHAVRTMLKENHFSCVIVSIFWGGLFSGGGFTAPSGSTQVPHLGQNFALVTSVPQFLQYIIIPPFSFDISEPGIISIESANDRLPVAYIVAHVAYKVQSHSLE